MYLVASPAQTWNSSLILWAFSGIASEEAIPRQGTETFSDSGSFYLQNCLKRLFPDRGRKLSNPYLRMLVRDLRSEEAIPRQGTETSSRDMVLTL